MCYKHRNILTSGSTALTVYKPHTSRLVKCSAVVIVFLFISSLAGTIMSGLIQGHSMDTAIKAGLRAAYYSLLSTRAVSPVLSPAMFSHDEMKQWYLSSDEITKMDT